LVFSSNNRIVLIIAPLLRVRLMPPAADNYAPVGFSFAKIAKTFQCAGDDAVRRSNSADTGSANHAIQSKRTERQARRHCCYIEVLLFF
jgi:hypothetical protein